MKEIRDAPWIRRAESEGYPVGKGYDYEQSDEDEEAEAWKNGL